MASYAEGGHGMAGREPLDAAVEECFREVAQTTAVVNRHVMSVAPEWMEATAGRSTRRRKVW